MAVPAEMSGFLFGNDETKSHLSIKSPYAFCLLLNMEKTSLFEKLRKAIESKGIVILRIAVGLIFLWFGFLKFFGNVSAAENTASQTILWLTNDRMKPEISMPILAALECLIGIGILSKKLTNYVLPILYFQMAGTLLPLFIFPGKTWQSIPFVPTLEGQYIIKNAVLIAAGIVLGAISNGGKLIRDPEIAHQAEKAEEEKSTIDNR